MLLIKSLTSLPSPSNISYWWNFGSLLGACLSIQLVTGLFLAMQYSGDTELSFLAVTRISQDVSLGWALRSFHMNGASAFFLCLYLHIGRGLYYSSPSMAHTWSVGVTILLLVMASAFLGYVLPWGQMSFWGASVITSLVQAIPTLGNEMVIWLWGGFAVGNPTLTRFFTFHFVIPFLAAAMVVLHIFFLHSTGSSNPLGVSSNLDKIEFHSLFSSKDMMGLMLFLSVYFTVVLNMPWALGDPENFILANPLVTPVHIQPEWYFLFAYAILRSIPNKLGGVVALVLSVAMFYLTPLFDENIKPAGSFMWANKPVVWVLVSSTILLTWIGARPVESPYVMVGQVLAVLFFSSFFSKWFIQKVDSSF